ncbi:hypothetical protein NEOKW01_0913 [Nematocida sp. AWRm80]|nr:hypothetical protein NEOKW01_0913 [Nematocida sp. AWRm80]
MSSSSKDFNFTQKRKSTEQTTSLDEYSSDAYSQEDNNLSSSHSDDDLDSSMITEESREDDESVTLTESQYDELDDLSDYDNSNEEGSDDQLGSDDSHTNNTISST